MTTIKPWMLYVYQDLWSDNRLGEGQLTMLFHQVGYVGHLNYATEDEAKEEAGRILRALKSLAPTAPLCAAYVRPWTRLDPYDDCTPRVLRSDDLD